MSNPEPLVLPRPFDSDSRLPDSSKVCPLAIFLGVIPKSGAVQPGEGSRVELTWTRYLSRRRIPREARDDVVWLELHRLPSSTSLPTPRYWCSLTRKRAKSAILRRKGRDASHGSPRSFAAQRAPAPG